MPNWTANELYISFSNKEEKELFANKAKFEDKPFSFNSFIPMPEGMNDTTSPHRNPEEFINSINSQNGTKHQTLTDVINGNNSWFADIAKGLALNLEYFRKTGYYNWYDWSYAHWGVKWDACHSTLAEESDTTICYHFDSPWDTPIYFFNKLFAMYPELEFRVVSYSVEDDRYLEIVKEDNEYNIISDFDSLRDAVENGKLGGVDEWQFLFEEDEEEVNFV